MKEGYIRCPRGPWPSLRSNPAPHMAKTVCMPGRCSSVLAPHQVWITNHVYTYKSIKTRNKAELLKMQFSAAPAGTQFLALPVAHSPFCWDLSSVVSDGGCVPAYCMTVVQMELAFSGDVLRTSPLCTCTLAARPQLLLSWPSLRDGTRKGKWRSNPQLTPFLPGGTCGQQRLTQPQQGLAWVQRRTEVAPFCPSFSPHSASGFAFPEQ